VLLLLQGICLGVGLWMHDRFLASTTHWVAPAENDPDAEFIARVEAAASRQSSSRNKPTDGNNAATTQADDPRLGRLIESMPIAGVISFAWIWGLQSVIAYFLLARVHVEHSRQVLKSDEQSLQSTRDLLRTRDAVIFGLAKLAESRDPETGHHLERISLYSTRLAAVLSRHPRYRSAVTPSFVRLIGISSALHDIGKVGIEDSVLLKPGELTSTERFRMQLHAGVGADCIREIERRLGGSNFLEMAREIAHSHHERWDGKGYPEGLMGEQIPLAARIVAIADVYDALSVRRVYKNALPHDKCVAIIRDEAGRQFDPDLVRVFLEIEPQFQSIAQRFADEAPDDAEANRDGRAKPKFTPDQEQALLEALVECEDALRSREPVAGSV